MRNILNLASIIILSLSCSVSASDKADPDVIFSQMKSLTGVWVKEGAANSNLNIQFELTANDTTLIETWIYKGKKHSLTLYHLNGKNLMATHYCPQGNQPRLNLTNNSTPENVSFTYLDATNLASLEDSHQHSLGFEMSDSSSRLLRKESYLSKSGEELSELKLVRK
tara:strand:+ start:122 stop:622 length:501 start_codon:yes stop_codon:yes gene_type:complete